jgi:hypothetical protein
MDAVLNKVGSYWLGQKASKEFNSVGDDINVYVFPSCFLKFILMINKFDQVATFVD